jgi:hypothetical protein
MISVSCVELGAESDALHSVLLKLSLVEVCISQSRILFQNIFPSSSPKIFIGLRFPLESFVHNSPSPSVYLMHVIPQGVHIIILHFGKLEFVVQQNSESHSCEFQYSQFT